MGVLIVGSTTVDMAARNEGKDPVSIAETVASLVRKGVILKRGADGATVFLSNDDPPVSGEPYKMTPVSTIGAGDSFNAGVLYGLTAGWPWKRILPFANAVAASVISQERGTLGSPSADGVQTFMESRPTEGRVPHRS